MLRDDHVLPVRNEACDDVGQALGCRPCLGRKGRVPGVVRLRPWVLGIDRGRGSVVGATPQAHLLLAPFIARLILVEAGEVAIVTLVERAVAHGRHRGLTQLFEDQRHRMLRAQQGGGEADAEHDVAFTQFESMSRQKAVIQTLLPIGKLQDSAPAAGGSKVEYEFLPSPTEILEEIVPASFKARLFKCFLDAAVSEQIARMVAMKSATENADGMIRSIRAQYNRARQSQITSELSEIIGGAAALE